MPWSTPPEPPHEFAARGMVLIGAAVRRRREWHGWTQQELGWRTGIDQSTISRLENGRRFGLRLRRFALLVGVLGGLDFEGVPISDRWLAANHQFIEVNPTLARRALEAAGLVPASIRPALEAHDAAEERRERYRRAARDRRRVITDRN